ncbi:hypothetical protein M9458_022227, partial [Cirrhinus mrigala]
SSDVQGPDAARCNHGAKIPLQLSRHARGGQHVASPQHSRCGYGHMQPAVRCQPLAQHSR